MSAIAVRIRATALVLFSCLLVASTVASAQPAPAAPTLRPPSVPLVAVDPYFSIWSPADRLTDAPTVHWTGKTQPLVVDSSALMASRCASWA